MKWFKSASPLLIYNIIKQPRHLQETPHMKADAQIKLKNGKKMTVIVDLDYVEDLQDLWDQVRNIVPGVDDIENEDELVELANA